jgi:hypothetical protein
VESSSAAAVESSSRRRILDSSTAGFMEISSLRRQWRMGQEGREAWCCGVGCGLRVRTRWWCCGGEGEAEVVAWRLAATAHGPREGDDVD